MKLLFGLPALLIAFMVLTSGATAQGPPPTLSGDWAGSLQVGGTALRLVFHFTPKPGGTFSATLDSLDQGALGIPFSTAQVTGRRVHLEAAGIGAGFDGVLDGSGKIITGSWKQGGASLPLTLTQTSHAPTLDRPQEPKPPFPYAAHDVTFPGGASGVTLAGTLTLPPGAGPFPAVVLIAGSGPNDRDETIFGHKPFLLLADTLTRRGIAVLRYDKRGIGQSTGNYAVATTADFSSDAQAAVVFLKTQAAINPKKIGLLGHSEGGVIAPMVATAHPSEIAFAVLLAGSALPGEQILLKQTALIGRASGVSAAQITRNAALQRRLFALAEAGGSSAKVQAAAFSAIQSAVATMPSAQKAALGDPQEFAEAQSRSVASPWMRFFLTYDPAPALKKTHCPVLALNGAKDLQVSPAENLAAITKALKAGGSTHFTVKELPDLNHLFQTSVTGSPSEYAALTETMAPVALTTISDWIATQTR